jgi:hypothetical protein
MKTSELINTLAVDRAPRGLSLASRFWLALGLGTLVSAALFMIGVGPRADFAAAAHTLRFDLKFVDTLALALPTALLCFRLTRPDARAGTLALLLVTPFLLLGAAVVAELFLVPSSTWGTKMIGINSLHCLTLVPLLSIAPLVALIYAMRSGAPQHPTLSGALAGAAAAGVAATLYATNCPDDSPLFVATWYPLATLIVVGVGAVAGHRFLRW